MTTTTTESVELTINSKEQLKQAYLHFLSKGGLVVPVATNHQLGDMVEVKVKLFDDEVITFTGKIAWMTPPGSHIAHHNGIGVELSDDNGRAIRKKIEVYLAGTQQ